LLDRLVAALFVLALLLALAGPALQLAGSVRAIAALDTPLARTLGVTLACARITFTVIGQLAMGEAWRIGVDPGERTTLVTSSPFAVVRNPIFAAMMPVFAGVALLAPTPSLSQAPSCS
jgi:protein-S-isoprenylcysteine O-methyltransferase Ste14